MSLNDLLFTRLSTDERIAGALAEFAGVPAVFNSEFPPDQQDGWKGNVQYPRISYRIDMQVDPKRSSSGQLSIAVYTERDMPLCEQIEGYIRDSLKDVLMKPEGEAPFCVAWARTEPYEFTDMAVIGRVVIFDILEYPSQETTDPDPVMAMNNYIKKIFPDSIVLGMDRIGEFTSTADRPVWYCRLNSLERASGYCENQIMWFNAVMSVHLICPNAPDRLKMAAALAQMLSVATEIIMLDDSPMTMKGVRVDNRADYLRDGQMTVTGYYGCLRKGELKHLVTGAGINFNFTVGGKPNG